MAFLIKREAIKSVPNVGGFVDKITPSDTVGCTIGGYYPRGFTVFTGGTLTLWVEDTSTNDMTKKLDLGTVPDGFTWSYAGFFGIAATDESGSAITASNIIALP